MNGLAECPVCFIRLPSIGDSPTNLSLHMSIHSKEEVVAALLGRTRNLLENSGVISGMPEVSLSSIGSASTSNTFVLPQNSPSGATAHLSNVRGVPANKLATNSCVILQPTIQPNQHSQTGVFQGNADFFIGIYIYNIYNNINYIIVMIFV